MAKAWDRAGADSLDRNVCYAYGKMAHTMETMTHLSSAEISAVNIAIWDYAAYVRDRHATRSIPEALDLLAEAMRGTLDRWHEPME